MMDMSEHQRANYDRTDHLLVEASALLEAVIEFADAPEGSALNNIAHTLRHMATEKVRLAQRAHSMEWAGLGGNCPDLTDDEIAESKGV